MYWRFTRKRAQDAAQIQQWRERPQADFIQFGITAEDLAEAQIRFQGTIITKFDVEAYEKARKLSNPVFDPHPLIIFLCVAESDVAIILGLAARAGIPFTVRSGGHCTAGFSAGPGFLIDVSGLNDVVIDTGSLTAHVGAGCNFRKLSPLLDRNNLHLPIGDCPEVCVAGYMQGGGYSFTSRTFGMNCDNVLDVRVMLADGRIVTASDTQNYDLFWAVCGGTGGNFGVLLSVTFRLRRLGDIMGFSFIWPLVTDADRATAANALLALQKRFLSTAPSAMTPQMIFTWQPSLSGSGVEEPCMLCRGTYVGTEQQGLDAIKGIDAIPGAIRQYAKMGIFSKINAMLLTEPYDIPPFPPGIAAPFEDKQARYVARDLSTTEWKSVLDWFVTSPVIYNAMCFEIAGGIINMPPLEANAFIHRTSQFSAFLDVFWWKEEERGPAEAFLDQFCELFNDFWNGEIYQNYPSIDVPDYRANYWGRAFDAVCAVKQKYDPLTFFTFAQAAIPYPDGPRTPTWPPKVVTALAQPIVVTHDAAEASMTHLADGP